MRNRGKNVGNFLLIYNIIWLKLKNASIIILMSKKDRQM